MEDIRAGLNILRASFDGTCPDVLVMVGRLLKQLTIKYKMGCALC